MYDEVSFLMNLYPDPRICGHKGIVLIHCGWDRAKYTKLARLWKQWIVYNLYHATYDNQMSKLMLFLLTWPIATACSIHDCHKSLFWAFLSRWSCKKTMKDVWVVLDCGIKSYKLIVDNIPAWLGRVVRPLPDSQLPSEEELRDLWTAVGADVFIVDEIADLRLWFMDGFINVSMAIFRTLDKVHPRIRFIILTLWRFRRYNEIRWISVGVCNKTFTCAMLTGIESIAQSILADAEQSHYFISGFERLTPDIKSLIVVVGLASGPADACLRMNLEDSRVCKRHVDMKAAVLDEMLYLDGLLPSTWEALGNICEMSGARVRSKVLSCAHVSIAFLFFRIFDALEKYPHKLFTGSIPANIAELEAAPEPPEEMVAGRVCSLLQQGFNKVALRKAAEEGADIKWGVDIAEDQHASTALGLKYHPEITEEALRVRAHAHAARRMLHQDSELEKAKKKWLRHHAKLKRRQPEKIVLAKSSAVNSLRSQTGSETATEPSRRRRSKKMFSRPTRRYGTRSRQPRNTNSLRKPGKALPVRSISSWTTMRPC